jgi:hypothetical protein
MSVYDVQVIAIRELLASCVADPQRGEWLVEVRLDRLDGSKDCWTTPIKDPFTLDDYDHCRKYLEPWQQNQPYSLDEAKRMSKRFEDYQQNLFQQLNLKPHQLWASRIDIDVFEAGDSTPLPHTINRVHWELMEDPKLWCKPEAKVIVRRMVSSEAEDLTAINNTARIYSWTVKEMSIPSFSILLVVARRLFGGPNYEHNDVNPSLAQMAILEVSEKLKELSLPYRVRLEIVRPGSFEAFKRHLHKKCSGKNQGYFHVVHFDVHGCINPRAK